MLKAYLRQYEFLVWVDLAWVTLVFDGVGDPVTDESFLKSLGYTALSLALWLGLLVGGGWLAATAGGFWAALAVVVVWGFAIAPVVVVLALKAALPGISGRLQRQVDALQRRAAARKRSRAAGGR